MNDQDKTREQLIAELVELRQRVAEQDAQLVRSRQAEADQRQINNSLPVLVATAGLDGYYKEVNAAFERILGWSEQESLSRPFLEFIHPEDRAVAVKTFARLQAGTPAVNFLDRKICKDGSHRWISWIVISVPGRDIMFGIGQDITEQQLVENDRQRAVEALKESEERFQAFMDNSPSVAWMKDEDGRYVYLSKSYENRVRVRFEDWQGKTDFELWPVETAEQFRRNDQAVLASGEVIEAVEESVDSNGERRYWLSFKFPFQDAQGKRYIGGAGVDITDQKRAEKALQNAHDELERRVEGRTAELRQANELLQAEVEQRRQAEEAVRRNETKYRALVESCPDPVVMIDLQGRVVFASQRAAEQQGVFDPDELIGRQATDFVVESQRQELRASIAHLIEDGVHRNVEFTFLRKDGTRFDAEISSAVIRDDAGKPKTLMAVYRDITERKKSEAALVESEEKYRHLVETTDTGYLILDEDGRVVDANAEYVRISGHSDLREIIGRSVVEWTAPYDAKRNAEEVQKCLRKGQVRQLEVDYVRDDGMATPIEINASVVKTSQGKRILSLCRDITERRQAETKLKREQQALRRMVVASDHERRLITYELHDGPVQQLVGALMLFQSPTLQKVWQSPETEAAYRDGMAALLHAQLELRRVVSSLRTPVLEAFGVVDAIQDVAGQLASAPGAPEIEYHHDVQFRRLEPTLENSLFRIAQEAMANACRHSKSDKVRVQLTQEGDEVTLEVCDWGIGFDQDAVQENRFGLESIRERCRILRGELTITSEPGKGTVVRAKFPVVEAKAE